MDTFSSLGEKELKQILQSESDPNSEDEANESRWYDDWDTDSEDFASVVESDKEKERQSEIKWLDQKSNLVLHDFDYLHSGLGAVRLGIDSSEMDFLKHFLDEDVMRMICVYTNARWTALAAQDPLSRLVKLANDWWDIQVDELYVFFALVSLTARMHEVMIQDLWSTGQQVSVPYFSETMAENRFWSIMAMLTFSPESTIGSDALYTLTPFIERMRNKFRDSFVPYQKLTITDTFSLFGAEPEVLRYPPLNSDRYKTRCFTLVDSKSNYIVDFLFHVGNSNRDADLYRSGCFFDAAKDLMENYLDKGYTFYLDERFSNPSLFQMIEQRQTNLCGRVDVKRCPNLPTFPKRCDGEHQFRYTNNLMALKYYRNSNAVMMTTWDCSAELQQLPITPSTLIEDYNSRLPQNNIHDVLIASHYSIRKTLNWQTRVAFHVVDLISVNANILHNFVTGRKKRFVEFQLEVIRKLVDSHKGRTIRDRRIVDVFSGLRLMRRHFIGLIPASVDGRACYNVCHVCSTSKRRPTKSKKKTQHMCPDCNVFLCAVPCFDEYHELEIY